MKNRHAVLAGLAATGLALACATNPAPGRKQFMLRGGIIWAVDERGACTAPSYPDAGVDKGGTMAVNIRKIILWRAKVPNRPGALAEVLKPLAAAGVDLQVVMGYREHGSSDALIETYPISGRKLTRAAEGAGLRASSIPAVLVQGDNRAGLGHRIAKALADGGRNVAFLVAQVVGRKFSAVYGFENVADADRAVKLIRKGASSRR